MVKRFLIFSEKTPKREIEAPSKQLGRKLNAQHFQEAELVTRVSDTNMPQN